MQVLGEVPEELRLTPERDARLLAQAQALARDRRGAADRPGVGGAGGDRQRRPGADPAGAGAGQGRGAGGRPVDGARCWPDRAAGGGAGAAHGRAAAAAAPAAPAPPRRADARPAPRPSHRRADPHAPSPRPPAPEPAPRRAGRAPDAATRAASPPRRRPSHEPAVDPETAPDPPAAASPGSPSCRRVAACWPAVVDIVRQDNAMLAALLADARPVALDGHERDARVPGRRGVPQEQGRAGRLPAGDRRGAALGHRGRRWRCATSCRDERAAERRGRRRLPARSSCDD